MMSPSLSSRHFSSGWLGWAEGLVIGGLMLVLVWTTLCLGGFLAETMIVTSAGIFGLAALGGLVWLLKPAELPSTFNRAALLPVPFLLYALVSVLWIAPAEWLAWREWLLWLQTWLVFVLVLHFGRGRKAGGLMVITLVGLGVAGTAFAAYQRFSDPGWMMLGRVQANQFFGRSSGMFGIPNSLAGLLELMIPVGLTLLFSRATGVLTKILCAWLVALFIFAFVLTGSRGGWISLGMVGVLWPLLALKGWRRRLAGGLAVLVLLGAGGWGLFRFSEHARSRIQPFLDGEFEASRPIIWKAGYQLWRDQPILGTGAASYNVRFDQYRARGFLNEPNWAHNDYVNTLSDYGVIGFLLWFGAGIWLFWWGSVAVRRAYREQSSSTALLDRGKWRLGLLLGLLAYAFHLAVDFHTKIPALAFAFAVGFGLLLRDEPGLRRELRLRFPGVLLIFLSISLFSWVALPLYRAEALRYHARRAMDRQALQVQKEGDELRRVIAEALTSFERATEIDPANGQAWADWSYAIAQSWHMEGGDLIAIGQRAEIAANRSLALCSVNAEYWLRKGVSLDMQARQIEGESCFRKALALAPNTPACWYYYAYHLQARPGRLSDALAAVETCLTLDPSNSAAVLLREQLAARRQSD